MVQLNWDKFPDAASGKMLLKLSWEAGSSAKHPQKRAKKSVSLTPYQFTLPVMFGLYCHLQGSVKFRKGQIGKIHSASDYVQSGSHKLQEKYLLFAETLNDGHPPKPISWHQTHKLVPLRAIAYFSWEGERRCFLARRVFPTYFDFLSYSYVPEGWGALGMMLRDIVEGNYESRSHAYTMKLLLKTTRLWLRFYESHTLRKPRSVMKTLYAN